MNIEELIAHGWQQHAGDAEGVLQRLREAAGSITEIRHLPAFASLVVHVTGEHLGRWSEGIELLRRLEGLPVFDPASTEGRVVLRSRAVLHHCAGESEEERRCLEAGRSGGDHPEASDRVRVLAIAASALAGQGKVEEASRDLEEALALAAYGPAKDDPAARALAVTGNNLACVLEERPTLTSAERALMLRAAQAGLDFWRIAGGWMEEERAFYRLALSNLKAGEAKAALEHARRCLEIVEANGSDPVESFFAHEALARSLHALGAAADVIREREAMIGLLPVIDDASMREYCREELTKMDQQLSLAEPGADVPTAG